MAALAGLQSYRRVWRRLEMVKAVHELAADPNVDMPAFIAALDAMADPLRTAVDKAIDDDDLDTAKRLNIVLTKILFFQVAARDTLIAAIDKSPDVKAAQAALKGATDTLKKTAAKFPASKDTTDLSDSLDKLAKAVNFDDDKG